MAAPSLPPNQNFFSTGPSLKSSVDTPPPKNKETTVTELGRFAEQLASVLMPSHDRTQTLVLDTAPLLTSSLSSLLQFSNRFLTTQDVIDEVRGKGQRERLEQEWKMLDATLNNSTGQSGDEWTGLQVREPSAVGISKIKEFASKTGDIAVLSAADIRVLALAYDQDQSSADAPAEGTGSPSSDPQAPNSESAEPDLPSSQALDHSESVEQLVEQAAQLTLETAANPSRSSENELRKDLTCSSKKPSTTSEDPTRKLRILLRLPATSTGSSWITPDNVHIHQAKDMGFFPSLGSKPAVPKSVVTPGSSSLAEQHPEHDGQHSDVNTPITISTVGESSSKPPTMKAAVLTGDYAMQNVALQIGLNVLGVGGKRIRDVKTFVLRCYGCFKLCKDPTRKFCPTCGGATLTRVSITYTPSSPTGYILHLNPNFQYRNRGTVYSIPSAKPGSSSFEKGGAKQRKSTNGASLVLREDQKEFQRGLKSVMIQKQKEERKLKNMDGAPHSNALTSLSGWNDPDWEPAMLLGEKGRKSSGRGTHHNDSVRYGKDGLPVIGFGKNPNEVRRRGKR
ncbi:hypothetical protein PCASD_10243 [Puccinia coronata f. sp. avenae]|uniref:20S-pre-rRNA D-site endonuclease NOB1 n=1 Tax=Puccinia coronata f. sp. avenae TaxID=200324 RepID=A0A2N5UD74_9BASI|nr:hypothetical protein PCASD_10243 [Puccinia coronata f. sp. avenae]